MGTKLEELWTPEDEALLAQQYGRIPRRELAKRLGRSESAVKNRVRVLGLPSPQSWTHIMMSGPLMGYSQQGVNKLIHHGALPAKKYNNWQVLRSEALRVKRIVEAGGGCWQYK